MKGWRLKKETWIVCRPVVADSNLFEEAQDPKPDPDPNKSEKMDPDQHSSEKLDPDRIGIQVKSWIRTGLAF
jgi:hypothetical protein